MFPKLCVALSVLSLSCAAGYHGVMGSGAAEKVNERPLPLEKALDIALQVDGELGL
jgi:hypothetical protein